MTFFLARPGVKGFTLALAEFRLGSAAGCEAVAVPRRQRPYYSRAMPLVRALPFDLLGQRRYQGHSPKCKKHFDGGAQPPPHIGRQSRNDVAQNSPHPESITHQSKRCTTET